MAGKQRGVPQYKLHKPTGQARIILDAQHVYLLTLVEKCSEGRAKSVALG